MASIQGIYIALFGRPADPIGLAFYNEATNNGQDLSAIHNLAGEAEYLDRFAGMNNTQIVTSIYQSLFGRNPDLTGLTYFVSGLNSGEYTINDIAIRILDGATGTDAELVAAKEAAAQQFTDAVAADPDALAAYQGASGIAFGNAFMAQVTSADVEFTDAEVAAQVETFVTTGNVPGEDPTAPVNAFTLTDAVGENVSGTADNDEFTAVLDTGAAADSTLNVGDRINGLGGVDTLNLYLTGAANTALPGGANIQNVEIINLISDGTGTLGTAGTLNVAGAFAGSTQIWQANAANAIAGLSAAQTAGFRDITAEGADVALAASFSGATGSVALEGVSSAADAVPAGGTVSITLTGTGTGANVLRTANVSGEVEADVAVEIVDGAGAATIRTLNLSLSEDVTVDVSGVGALRTFNAAGSAGDLAIVFDMDDHEELTSITLGSGSDSISVEDWLAADNKALTINLGAGNDTLTLEGGESGAAITGGAGTDTFVFADLANVTDATELDDQIISITDFNGDVLDISAVVGASLFSATLVNGALAGLDADATLADALEAISNIGTWAAGEVAVFKFDGSTFVFADNGTAGFDDGDGVLELVGFTGTLTAGDNLFI